MTEPTGTVRIGVDAGGTGTRAVVTRDGVVVDRLSGGPLNVLLHADALDRLALMIGSSGATEAGLGLAGGAVAVGGRPGRRRARAAHRSGCGRG